MTEEQPVIAELVGRAQSGEADAKEALARKVEPAMRAYIYRVTLDKDSTDDLFQETMLAMVKSLPGLSDGGRFWPWVYGIAQSKIQQHYRYKRKKAAISASVYYEDILARQQVGGRDEGLRKLLEEELARSVMSAMKEIKHEYRSVLSLRCLERLSYCDIALALRCSEMKARVLFFRAKQALKRELHRQGVSKTLMVLCLGTFGKATAPAGGGSSLTVTPASTRVGLRAAVVGTVGTKAGLTAIVTGLVGLVLAGSVAVVSSGRSLPNREDVRSLHYTVQAQSYATAPYSSFSRGAYEQWCYFPDGVDGAVLTKIQRWDPKMSQRLCVWLQNDRGNYYYHPGEEKVYVNNYRLWLSSLRVNRLPTDPAVLTDFISGVEGELKGVEYRRDSKSGLLVESVDRRFANAPLFRTSYEYNSLDGQQFAYYWPDSVPVVDQRDEMHKRGWTYFCVAGEVRGSKVSGAGRVPFVYSSFKKYPPWLVLQVGEEFKIVDCNGGACICRGDAAVRCYPAGSFFKGLGRPWIGLHTIDILRRDAAASRIWFDTQATGDGDKVIVAVLCGESKRKTTLRYVVELEADIVKTVKLKSKGRSVGSLVFSYLQGLSEIGDEFAEPVLPDRCDVSSEEGLGISWLASLADGTVEKE